MTKGTQILFRPFRLDVANERLVHGDRPIALPPKAFAVLHLLLSRAGCLVTKEDLLRSIWAGAHVQDSVLKVRIRQIRSVLNDPAGEPRFIETVHRRGYRFIGTIGGGDHEARPRLGLAGFVGRASEISLLHRGLERALLGERQVAFITGEAGIGKTATVQAFLAGVPEAVTWIARGTCLEHYGAGEAYLPVLEALGRLARDSGDSRLVPILRRHAPTWLIQMPALINEEDRNSLRREILGATKERMLREMAEAVEVVTQEAPLILVIEDLHWSDYSTLDLIASLARRREPARLMLLGTYRPSEVLFGHHPLESVRQELVMRRQCHELPLGFLDEDAVSEYLNSRFPDAGLAAELARAIHRRTGGNPLFMVNVVDYLVSRDLVGTPSGNVDLARALEDVQTGLPDSLRQMIERQIDRLPAEERRVLEAASVAGLEFSCLAVAAGLEVPAPAIEESCEDLARRAQFIRPTGIGTLPDGTPTPRYVFIHPLYQNVLYDRLPPARRLRLHRRIGDRGQSVYGERAGEIAAELAMHFEQARDHRKAIEYLRRAADNAARRFANREAIGHLTRAVDLVGRLPASDFGAMQTSILEQVGTVRRSMGDMQGAADDFRALITLAREQGRVDSETRGLFYLGSTLSWIDRERFEEAARQAVDLSRRLEDPLLRAHTAGYAAYWNLLIHGWHDEDAGAPAAAIAAAARAGDRQILGQHVVRYAYFQCLRSDYEAGCLSAREGIDLAIEAGDGFDFLLAKYFLAWGLLHRGRWGEMLGVLEEGIRMAATNGHLLWATLFRLEMAWLYEQVFHFDAARELCERAIKASRETAHGHGQVVGHVLLEATLIGSGRGQRAPAWFGGIADPLQRETKLMDRNWQMPLCLWMSDSALHAGDLPRARAEALRALALAEGPGERTYLSLARRALALIADSDGDRGAADEEIASALENLHGAEAPMAEWKVCATAAGFYRRWGRTREALVLESRCAGVIEQLTAALGSAPVLRRSFLSSVPVRSILDRVSRGQGPGPFPPLRPRTVHPTGRT